MAKICKGLDEKDMTKNDAYPSWIWCVLRNGLIATLPRRGDQRATPLQFVILLALLLSSPSTHGAGTGGPLRVFILAGQSNMEGQAVVDLNGKDYNGGRGTLVQLMRDPVKAPLFKHLKDAQGKWTVRDDVWVRYRREQGPLLSGPLGFGFSVYGDSHHFGPELQFGHVIGNHFDNQVLLIKCAWGGKSLYQDFRPPSSGGEVGKYYKLMIAQVREALANLKQDFPGYDGSGHELAGFVWYHGWNDGVSPKTGVVQYQTNLVNLINDVRREFTTPKLPVVIGELTGPWVEAPPEWTQLRQAQAAAATRPEFAGNVAFVPTRDFVRKPEDSPNPSHGHHEFGNAETYFLIGNALGESMKNLLAPPAIRFDPATREIEGWTVHIEPTLINGQHREEGTQALSMLANHLQRIRILVPAEPLAKLQTIGIWVEHDHPKLKSMQYHPSRSWLVAHGHDPRLARKVHITQARELLSRNQMLKHPAVVLHELAHGYHDQFLGFDNPEIISAFNQAKASGSYTNVLLYTGQRVKHYGLTDHKEYFSEGTEAYLYRNDFFPFVRAELMEHDPTLHNVLLNIWGKAN